jgi:hypothetical protein
MDGVWSTFYILRDHYWPSLGTWFAGFVADEARELGTTVEALGAWRPAAGAPRARRKKAEP